MTTSCSSLIILVLNILFTTPSFVSSTERRNDDVTLPQLQTLVQQQGVTIQQQAVTMQQQGAIIQQQAALLQTLQAKLTADETTAHQQAALLQTLQAKVAADESTIRQQGVTIQQQGVTIQQLQAKQSTMEARQNQNVAFTASFIANGPSVNIGEHGTVMFDQVITNIGGGYHTATGMFTAPVGGVYAFTLNIRSDNFHKFILVEITKNGNTHLCGALVEGPTHDTFDKSSCSAVVHLNVGEQVFARRQTGDTFLEESEVTALTGFLVHAD